MSTYFQSDSNCYRCEKEKGTIQGHFWDGTTKRYINLCSSCKISCEVAVGPKAINYEQSFARIKQFTRPTLDKLDKEPINATKEELPIRIRR